MKSNNFKLKSAAPGKKSKTFIIIVLGVILLAGAAIGGIKYKRHSDALTAQKFRAEEVKKNDSKATNTNSGKSRVTPPGIDSRNNEDIPINQSLSVNISSLGQEGSVINSTATASGVNSEGTCLFSFSSTDSKPVVKQVVSSKQDGSQNCSVSIPRVEFDKRGSWNLLVTFYSDNTKTSATRNIILE